MYKLLSLFACVMTIAACSTSNVPPISSDFDRAPDLRSKQILLSGHNTFLVNDNYVTLYGIEPIYMSQKCLSADKRVYDCGRELMSYFREVLPKAKSVRCFFANNYQATYVGNKNHLPMHCFINGMNLNELLVSAGYATAYDPRYSRAESVARTEEVGIWQGQFMHPQDYAAFTADSIDPNLELYKGVKVYSPTKKVDDICVIKAMHRDGQKIYLMPSDNFYKQAKINRILGDKMLCSEHEALEQGFARTN